MEPWEAAVDKFLEPWRRRKCVIGAMVCGSYVTGDPSKHSDLDVQIILAKGTCWRERGNRIVDDFEIDGWKFRSPATGRTEETHETD